MAKLSRFKDPDYFYKVTLVTAYIFIVVCFTSFMLKACA